MSMKDQILKLRKEGRTYKQITEILGCSKAVVSYHCSEKVKQKYRDYRNKNRKKSIRDFKSAAGGKCSICGYDKCSTSLVFHHKNPNNKISSVGEMIYTHGKRFVEREVKKCVLLCANCHGELHEGLLKI
jgi:5-methylcytosine-specific restriction endonuclease McrA